MVMKELQVWSYIAENILEGYKCEWTLADIKNRASDKAFAKVTILNLDIETYKRDLKNGNIGGITYEEAENVLEGYKKELQVWSYITELIEKQ